MQFEDPRGRASLQRHPEVGKGPRWRDLPGCRYLLCVLNRLSLFRTQRNSPIWFTVGTDSRKVVTDGWDAKNVVATDINPGPSCLLSPPTRPSYSDTDRRLTCRLLGDGPQALSHRRNVVPSDVRAWERPHRRAPGSLPNPPHRVRSGHPTP